MASPRFAGNRRRLGELYPRAVSRDQAMIALLRLMARELHTQARELHSQPPGECLNGWCGWVRYFEGSYA